MLIMDKKIFTTRVKTNLNGVLQMTQTIDGIMMTGDNAANQLIVEVYDGFDKVNLVSTEDNKIVGYFIRSDGYTIEVDGEIEDGNAKVIIPEVAYQVSGALSMAIRYFEGKHEVVNPDTGTTSIIWDTKIVIAALSCYIQMTESNALIDPTHHIPDVQELLEYIDVLNQERADIASEESSRVIAENLRVEAEALRQSTFETNETQRQSTFESAEEAREQEYDDFISDINDAESERIANETTRQTNETTRESNETTRIANETTRQANESTRQSQESARETAQAQRNAKIDGMTVEAVELNPYDTPTATITEVSGHKHIIFGLRPGDPFVIQKTFASIAEMEAYSGTDIRVGQFVIITSNVDDPDNAKMFVKTSSGYSFVTDLSGAQGIQGPRGYTGNGISSVVLNQDYTLTVYFTDGDSYTTPNSIRGLKGETGNGIALIEENNDKSFTITMTDGTIYTTSSMKGEIGNTGNGIASITRNSDYTLTITMTNGSSYTTDPIKGEPGPASIEFDYDAEDHSLVITYF